MNIESYPVIENARITSAKLYIEDHGIFTFDIRINVGAFCVSVGGYALDTEVKTSNGNKRRVSNPAGLECMRKIMDVVGVGNWDDLKNQYIRFENNGLGKPVTKIGNIVRDEWIDIDEFFREFDYKQWGMLYGF